MEHRLVVDYQAGRYAARCTCGGWHEGPVPSGMSRIRRVYPALEAGHRRHVAASRTGVVTPAKA